jgi:ubiquinone/menaquinone biosynthesis C-methylase UbiE
MSSDAHAAYWDRQAATYDRTTQFLEPRLLAPARRWVAQRVSGRTLEVAVGTGANLAYVAQRATDLTVTDVSAAMLDAAVARARTLGVPVRPVHADVTDLPLPDGSFDTVLCTFAMCCVPDERAAMAAMARVLKPGGMLVLADHVASSTRTGRSVQRVLDAFSSRASGERFRRRPLLLVDGLGLELVESAASRWRLVEHFAARKPSR